MARSDDELVLAAAQAATRRFHVRGEEVIALDAVDAEFVAGALTTVAGPSGSGKSTLLSLLGCLDRPTSGAVQLAGRDIHQLSRRRRRALRRTAVTMLLPLPADNLLAGSSGRENIAVGAQHRDERAALVQRVVDDLSIGEFVDRLVDTMSGGEQQRVAIACVLARGCSLVLADEPTGALDAGSAADVVQALRAAAATGVAVVVASHDPMLIEASDRVIRLDHGRRVG